VIEEYNSSYLPIIKPTEIFGTGNLIVSRGPPPPPPDGPPGPPPYSELP